MNTRTDAAVQPMTLAVAATFTAQAIEQSLAFWIEQLALSAHVVFAPYNQPFQELLDPSSLLSTNKNGVNIFLIRLEDWLGTASTRETDGSAPEWRPRLQQAVSDFIAAISAAAQRSTIPHLIVMCPASPQAAADPARSDFFRRMEALLVAGLSAVPGVDIVASDTVMRAYPVSAYYDPQGDTLAHAPYTRVCMTALATMIARRVYGLTQPDYKVVVVDCDNTLWTGTCGEDGPFGVEIDAASRAIQQFLVELHDRGVLLCLCSRNNEADVLAVFESRSDMPLALRHIVSSRLNWKAKSENIVALAAELQLAPDACVFLDDDPVECAEVQSHCPEVLTIQLPRRHEQVPDFLRNLWIFNDRHTTEEALRRTTLYAENLARARASREVPSLGDFLARLDLKIQIAPLAAHHLARASELTYRTNQFNLTTIRRSAAEIDALRHQGSDCVVVHVRDRFGDYGTVGLMIFRAESTDLCVDTFLLSCRALGRGVEHRMLASLGEVATQRGLTAVRLPFAWSGKNQPALDFLKETGGAFLESQDSASFVRLPAHLAAEVRYRPRENREPDRSSRPPHPVPIEAAGGDVVAGAAPRAAEGGARAKAAMLTLIARDLSDPEEIQAQVAVRTRARPQLDNDYVAPRTPTEQTIAAILAQVLGVDRVGVEDNFFQLGGHSLLAMQVLFRIRTACRVELSAHLLYKSAFTAADLARKVLEAQLRSSDPIQVAALLERVNELSDDEVRALLSHAGEAPSHTPD